MKLNIIFIVDYLHFKDLLKYKCELYMRQSLTSSQYKIFVAYYVSNHRLVIKTGRWSTIPFSRDNRLFHSCSYNMRHTLYQSVPYTTPLEISLNHYLRSYYQGTSSLSFNQTNKLVLAPISRRPLHSAVVGILASLMPPCRFQSHQPFGFLDSNINFISFLFIWNVSLSHTRSHTTQYLCHIKKNNQ